MRTPRFSGWIFAYFGMVIVSGVLVARGANAAAQRASFSSETGVQPLDSGTGGSPSTDVKGSVTAINRSVPAVRPSNKTAAQLRAVLDDLTALLDQYRREGNRHEQANVLSAMASAYRDLHEQQRSLESLNLALVLWRALGDKAREAETLSQTGEAYREWGFPDRAVPFFRQSLSVYPAANDSAGEAAALNGLAVAYLALHDKKMSLEYFNRALGAYRTNHDRLGEARAMSNIGATYFSLAHDPMKAVTTLQDAVTRLEVLNDSANEANALEIMGMAWERLGKPEMASVEFQRALMLFHNIGDAGGENSIRKQLSLLKPPSS